MMNENWIKTCKALKQLFEILRCSKCKKSLHDPQQFLNCGHFSCISCINNENTSCCQCQLPHENCNIVNDDGINQIIQACCTIAKEIGFRQDNENMKRENVNFEGESDSKPSISGNILTSTNSQVQTKKRRKTRKRKGIKNMNNNEDSKKARYDKFRLPKDLNKTNHLGETKLHEMCNKNHIENVKVLLDAGANPNVADFAKWTPLQETVDFNNYKVSKLLLDKGANVNQSGYEGRTPLHEAAKNNNVQMVNLLLQYKANKESVDIHGKRPVDCCQLEEVKILLNCDDDIEIIYEKRNNGDNSLENLTDLKLNAKASQRVLQNITDETTENCNVKNEFNSQENVDIVITSSINEIEQNYVFNTSSINEIEQAKGSRRVLQDITDETTENCNVKNEFNSQENVDIVNTSSINEIEQNYVFESFEDSLKIESEEIDIMN